jgi:hypothetical protein
MLFYFSDLSQILEDLGLTNKVVIEEILEN